jgi:diaminohydroxyphosphoribosylaminopyrimidine deaminase/5-amino-6-(5-phosphoribosylamino)uracil reductase
VPCERQPRRIVIDSRLDLPPTARILSGAPPLVLTVSADRARREALEARGAEVVVVPAEGAKTDLAAVARLLAERGFNEVTVETGTKLNGSLLRAGVVDEIVLYVAPMLMGEAAQGLFALGELTALGQALRPAIVDVRRVGEDLRLTARLQA